jgi:hypothetical protein
MLFDEILKNMNKDIRFTKKSKKATSMSQNPPPPTRNPSPPPLAPPPPPPPVPQQDDAMSVASSVPTWASPFPRGGGRGKIFSI